MKRGFNKMLAIPIAGIVEEEDEEEEVKAVEEVRSSRCYEVTNFHRHLF